MRMTPTRESNPSISTSSWFKRLFAFLVDHGADPSGLSERIEFVEEDDAGALLLACSNRSRTRAAPTPTNISTNSDPLIEKNGTAASPATALASSVLPVPGGPTSRIPFGIFPPSRRNFSGVLRNSMIFFNSCFASSTPATSAKRDFHSFSM